MKKLILLIVWTSIIACTSWNRLYEHEVKITTFLIKNQDSSNFELVLDTISSFQWDEIIVAWPYTNFKGISKTTTYNFNRFSHLIKDNDRFMLIGFINKKKGIKYIEIDRYSVSDTIFKNNKNGYKIYSRKNSNLLISR